jgi:hypothetical protein
MLLREKHLCQRLGRGSGSVGGHVQMFKWDGSVGSLADGSNAKGPLSAMTSVLPGQCCSLWAVADVNVGCPAVPTLLVVGTDSLNPKISPR